MGCCWLTEPTDPTEPKEMNVITGRVQRVDIVVKANTSASDANGRIACNFHQPGECVGFDNKVAIGHYEVIALGELRTEIAAGRETKVLALADNGQPWSSPQSINGSIGAPVVNKNDIDLDTLGGKKRVNAAL
jgi:hypothetical protein